MTPQEYNRLKAAALARAHVLRQEALRAFWAAVARRFVRFTRKEA